MAINSGARRSVELQAWRGPALLPAPPAAARPTAVQLDTLKPAGIRKTTVALA